LKTYNVVDLDLLENHYSKVEERGHEDAAKFLWLTIGFISGTI